MVLGASLLGGALLGYVTLHDRGAEVVGESSQPGWKTIRYHGVSVDIPSTWDRTDMDDCEFEFEHWAPVGAAGCGMDGGVAFYASATFDPAHGPGVRRSEDSQGAAWGGYTSAGQFAVHVADSDREVVVRVLRSAH